MIDDVLETIRDVHEMVRDLEATRARTKPNTLRTEQMQRDARFLLAVEEAFIVERVPVLLERIAALEAAMKALIHSDHGAYVSNLRVPFGLGPDLKICNLCEQAWTDDGEPERHAAECPVARARALLGDAQA